MPSTNEITEIFYLNDEFSREFDSVTKKHHLSGMRNLKHCYLFYVCKHMSEEFPLLFHTLVL
jgi:hypothetical protein